MSTFTENQQLMQHQIQKTKLRMAIHLYNLEIIHIIQQVTITLRLNNNITVVDMIILAMDSSGINMVPTVLMVRMEAIITVDTNQYQIDRMMKTIKNFFHYNFLSV